MESFREKRVAQLLGDGLLKMGKFIEANRQFVLAAVSPPKRDVLACGELALERG